MDGAPDKHLPQSWKGFSAAGVENPNLRTSIRPRCMHKKLLCPALVNDKGTTSKHCLQLWCSTAFIRQQYLPRAPTHRAEVMRGILIVAAHFGELLTVNCDRSHSPLQRAEISKGAPSHRPSLELGAVDVLNFGFVEVDVSPLHPGSEDHL